MTHATKSEKEYKIDKKHCERIAHQNAGELKWDDTKGIARTIRVIKLRDICLQNKKGWVKIK